jgi:hypothetical protein
MTIPSSAKKAVVIIDPTEEGPPSRGSLSRAILGGALVKRLTTDLVGQQTPRRLGAWIETGFDIYYARFPQLALMAAVGLGLGVVTFGFAMPVVAGVMALFALRAIGAPMPNERLTLTPWIGLNAVGVMVMQNLLAYGGTWLLSKVPVVSGFLVAGWAIAIETLFAFALLLVVGYTKSALGAVVGSGFLASKAGLALLWLYIMGAAASNVGNAFFGIGAVVTAPVLICVLTAAFVSLATENLEPSV